MNLKLDTARFDRDVRKLAKVMNQGLRPALDGQARLFVRDCIKATPPFTPGRNWTESLGAQKRVGDRVTKGQVSEAFKPVADLKILRGTSKASAALRAYFYEREHSKMEAMLRKMKVRLSGITNYATKQLHNKMRDRRGRVRGKRPVLVHNSHSIKELSDYRVAHVGRAKSGWMKAAIALALEVPSWISRHSSPGIFQRAGSDEKPSVTVGNGVPYIQGTGIELGIMRWALKNRERNLPKQIEAALRAQARKAKAT